ncbi:beta-glucosidase [Natronosporangium hydrolyticum]|uniref:Beta-glucosidase n=1 Tax=Natronosporangium hydrolyticum TaxID=2811111 RepID=A0A895YGH5_9ACTN|nr:GH1 family beta-glucosidase [Natronosporangium hydrolyticum]QSB14503.1 beta-glucosidase [Natronosporangium hydrolyticum]
MSDTQIDPATRVTGDAGGLSFPAGFVWGAATAAYQIEGAVTADGRGPSIWDTFSHTPGKVHNGDTGDVACDHYHRYAEDVELMAELGLQAYRFSIAWPRIQPTGSGPANRAGLDFYDRLVDALVARGIEPMITLYHWDLPQPLQDAGGWTNRDTAYRFAEYAGLVAERLADRVGTWITLNEPWCAAFLGYASGTHAPGITNPPDAFAATHHLLLGHGEAVPVLRGHGVRQVGITLNPSAVRPLDATAPADVAAAARVDGLQNRLYLDPLYGRGYPADIRALIDAQFGGAPWLRPGDEQIIAAPLDLLGINYYNPTIVTSAPGQPSSSVHPGTEDIRFMPATGPLTAMGWSIEPASLTSLLERLSRDYPGLPFWITENGCAYEDEPEADGERVADPARIAYLDGHLRAVHEAIARGVDVRGYLVWSLFDNFEWAEGYRPRFGIFYVDYETQVRLRKDSARWYHKVIAEHGLPD